MGSEAKYSFHLWVKYSLHPSPPQQADADRSQEEQWRRTHPTELQPQLAILPVRMANILIIFPPTGLSCAEQMNTVGNHLSEFHRKKHYIRGGV